VTVGGSFDHDAGGGELLQVVDDVRGEAFTAR
jgi:hypothetical protein